MALKNSSPVTTEVVLSTFEKPVPRRSSRHLSRRKVNLALLSMTLPGIAVLLLMFYVPMAGVLIAFENYLPYQGFFGSQWVGLQNFRFLFGTDEARLITYNTLLMNSLFILFGTLTALAIALLINEVRDSSRWKIFPKIYQSVIFFPYLISYVLVSYFTFALFNGDTGMANHILANLHLPGVDWFGSPQYWPTILVLVYLWKNVGFTVVIFLAGMVAISPEYYEAARLDGANIWQQVRYITLPLIKPLIILVVLLAIGRIFFADFGLFFQVPNNQPALYPTTDVVDTYVYRALITLDDVGMASAANLYQSAVGFILIFTANWFVRRIEPDLAAF